MAVHYPAIKRAGADVLLVSFHPPGHTLTWARQHGIPFRLGSDVTRETYFRYGLGEVKMGDLFGPKSWVAGVKALIGTGKIPSHSQHYKQAGGYFIVDDTGVLVYAYPSKGPADHSAVEELLGALEAVVQPE